MDRGNCALELFEENNCAQSVFVSCCDLTGLDKESALALSSGFGGGLASGEACGALCGAVMALGKLLYTDLQGAEDAKAKQREIIKYAAECFSAEFGALACRDLIRANGGKAQCPQFVQFCAQMVEKLWQEYKVK